VFDIAELYKDLFAHDINNILQNINTTVEIISQSNEGFKNAERLKEVISLTKDQIIRGSKLVYNVRKISQISQTGNIFKPKEVFQVLSDAKDFILKSFPDKSISITLDSQINTFYVQANDFLQDLFENLLLNSVRHNLNPEIEIQIKISNEVLKNKENIKIEFMDNGIGISDAMKEVIFEDGIKRNKSSKGMGLGLLLVKNIVDSYGGKILVDDKIKGDHSKGSNFIILLPEGR